jgi:hypothetical protein
MQHNDSVVRIEQHLVLVEQRGKLTHLRDKRDSTSPSCGYCQHRSAATWCASKSATRCSKRFVRRQSFVLELKACTNCRVRHAGGDTAKELGIQAKKYAQGVKDRLFDVGQESCLGGRDAVHLNTTR